MVVYLYAKYEVSSIILTSFRQAGGVILPLPPPPSPPQNEPLKIPPRLWLTNFVRCVLETTCFERLKIT